MADFMSLVDFSDCGGLTVSYVLHVPLYGSVFSCPHPALSFVSDPAIFPPSPSVNLFPVLCPPHTHTPSVLAVQFVLYLFSVQITCPFPRSLLPFIPPFPPSIAMFTYVLCTFPCVCSLHPSSLQNVIILMISLGYWGGVRFPQTCFLV